MAGGLAFTLFVCIIPLVLVIFSIIGIILDWPGIADQIYLLIEKTIPYHDSSGFARKVLSARIDEFRLYKSTAGIVGLLGLFFAAGGLFSSIRTVLSVVYKTQLTGSALLAKLRDIWLVLLVLICFLATMAILPALDILGGLAARLESLKHIRLSFLGNITLELISLGIVALIFYLVYRFIPRPRISRPAIIVSALTSAVMWEIAKRLFGFYVARVASFEKIYGTYMLMIVIALWIYYSAVVFIVGAEMGQLFLERKRSK